MSGTITWKPPTRSRMAWIGVIFVVLAILGSGLTLSLGGKVGHPSIQIVDASKYASPLYGELQSNVTVGYSENFVHWHIFQTSPFIHVQNSSGPGGLILEGSIQNVSAPTSVSIIKSATIDIVSYPILEAEFNVTKGISYGLRFFGQYSNGTQYNVWYDGSSLDHRPGNGVEKLRVNMLQEAFQATGRSVSTLTGFEVYVESHANNPTNFVLDLSQVSFSKATFGSMINNVDYRAVYIDLGNGLGENGSWSLNRIQLGVTISATSDTKFALYVLDGYDLFTTLETPSSYQFSQLTPSYDIVFYPSTSSATFPEPLPKSTASFVLVATTGSITNVVLTYVDLIYLPVIQGAADLTQSSLGQYFVYFVFFLFLLPVGMSLIIYQEFLRGKPATRFLTVLVLVTGLICRFALAPVAIHAFDMNVLLTSARGWFQYGTVRVSAGPTLPLTFFLYWIPYSFYALIQYLGFKDVFLPLRDVGIVEASFLKVFPILMDAFIFLILIRFKQSSKNLLWASFYFLNPLAIFGSAVYGHYDSATMGLMIAGTYWVSNQKLLRAGVALASAGLLELLGLVSLVFLLLKTSFSKQYKLSLALTGLSLLSFAYPPQRDLTYRLLLGISGLESGSQFSSGGYTLLGAFGLLGTIPSFLPLLAAGGLIVAFVSLDAARKRIQAKKILLYTCLSFVVFLLFLNLPNEWYWLVPVGSLYAIIDDNDNLGAFILVFGTSICFLTISYTVGSAYYLLGSRNTILASIESVRNGVQIFAVMVTVLAGLFLAYLRNARSHPTETLIRSSLLVLGSFILVYFWIGVYTF